MVQTNARTFILTVSGLVLTLAIAYSFDRWAESSQAAAGFIPLWLHPLANLTVAGSLLFLQWVVNSHQLPNRGIAILFVCVGGVLMLYTAYALVVQIPGLAMLLRRLSPAFLRNLPPTSSLGSSSAFITGIGVWGLARRK